MNPFGLIIRGVLCVEMRGPRRPGPLPPGQTEYYRDGAGIIREYGPDGYNLAVAAVDIKEARGQ